MPRQCLAFFLENMGLTWGSPVRGLLAQRSAMGRFLVKRNREGGKARDRVNQLTHKHTGLNEQQQWLEFKKGWEEYRIWNRKLNSPLDLFHFKGTQEINTENLTFCISPAELGERFSHYT